jgi:hypothetical protein
MSLKLYGLRRRDSRSGRSDLSEYVVMAIIETVDGICGTRSKSSGVRPEFEIKRRVSFYY